MDADTTLVQVLLHYEMENRGYMLPMGRLEIQGHERSNHGYRSHDGTSQDDFCHFILGECHLVRVNNPSRDSRSLRTRSF